MKENKATQGTSGFIVKCLYLVVAKFGLANDKTYRWHCLDRIWAIKYIFGWSTAHGGLACRFFKQPSYALYILTIVKMYSIYQG